MSAGTRSGVVIAIAVLAVAATSCSGASTRSPAASTLGPRPVATAVAPRASVTSSPASDGAPTEPLQPRLTLSRTSGRAGDVVTATVTGCPPPRDEKPYFLLFDQRRTAAHAGGRPLPLMPTDTSARRHTTFTIMPSDAPGPAIVEAKCAGPATGNAVAAFTIEG